MRTIARIWLTAAAVTAAVTVSPPAAVAKHGPRPDVLVPRGAVSLEGSALTGSFVVRNDGRRRAASSRATLTIRVAGRRTALGRFSVPRLRPGVRKRVRVRRTLGSGVPVGRYAVQACADTAGALRERREGNNCRRVGRIVVAPSPVPPPKPPTTGGPAPGTPPPPASSVPTAPIPFTPGEVVKSGPNWIVVPASYDASHQTPAALFVWLHGCGGQSEFDIYDVAPADGRTDIAMTVDGRENACWDVDADPARVLAAIADVKTHFNVDPKRVVLGGYSSGGDLAYRTAFYNSTAIAGVLAENTSPFKDTGSSQTASLAAAGRRFPVVHLAHTEDDTYPIDGVRSETGAMQAAGHPVTLIERAGAHYDAGTVPDLKALLLPHLKDGWATP